MLLDGTELMVRKHGAFSGHWTLEVEGRAIASAKKVNAFTRSFVIEDANDTMTLEPVSALGRSFRLEVGGEEVAAIRPIHAFTRTGD